MKKIILFVLLIGFAYSQTGNEFLKAYPFGKNAGQMEKEEFWNHIQYTSLIDGIISGNSVTNTFLNNVETEYNLLNRTCGMPSEQMIRIIKKWCDDNPSETHNGFAIITFVALMKLPAKSDAECLRLLK